MAGSHYPTIPAHMFQGEVVVTKPKINHQQALQAWVEKQDKHWPKNVLTAATLGSNIKCLHVAHWIISGKATGNWSAAIGTDSKRFTTCGTCNGRGIAATIFNGMDDKARCTSCEGRGAVEETYTVWNSQSGIAQGVVQGEVIDNIAKDVSPFHCGKRDVQATGVPLVSPIPQDICVIQPESNDLATAKTLGERTLYQALERDADKMASKMGSARDLRIGFTNIENMRVQTWLYPLYIGSYSFDNGVYEIQLDGVTGKMYVQTPTSIRNARIKQWLMIIGIVLAVVIVMALTITIATVLISKFW